VCTPIIVKMYAEEKKGETEPEPASTSEPTIEEVD
jgi:hypothetical protein